MAGIHFELNLTTACHYNGLVWNKSSYEFRATTCPLANDTTEDCG